MTACIVLVGMMGSGKSSVGQALSQQLGYQFIDTDFLIETETGASISTLFKEKGEAYFREIESQICRRLPSFDHAVISTGGGIVLREENRTLLKQFPVIWLFCDAETTLTRLQNDTSRPLLAENPRETFLKLMQERENLYQAVASLKVDTTSKSIDECVHTILSWLPA